MKKFTSAEYALFHRITSVSAAPGEKWAWAETTVAPDESEQSRVHIGGGASFPGRFPRWSPSGRTLAWLGADENGAEQIWLCAPDGSDARKLTNLRHGVKRFSWAVLFFIGISLLNALDFGFLLYRRFVIIIIFIIIVSIIFIVA